MHVRTRLLAALTLTTMMSVITGCLPQIPQAGFPAPPTRLLGFQTFSQGNFVPGEAIVRFRSGISTQAASSILSNFGLQALETIGPVQMGIQRVKIKKQVQMQTLLRDLNVHPSVLYAEPNYIVHLPKYQADPIEPEMVSSKASFPNDEMFDKQYAHRKTESQKGWSLNTGSSDVTVAIVDTGVDLKHPDLAEKIVPGHDFVEDDDNPMDVQGHGTHCAGIAASVTNNGIGVAGFAPQAKIMPVRVLDGQGSGSYADVANGIMWAAEHGANVISLSLGGPSSAQLLEDSIKLALEKDAVVVAAMGNSGNGSKSYPAAINGVMAVGATNSWDLKAMFSQYGDWISVAAPGVKILSTFPTFKSGMPSLNYGSISGTSMATPAVAGLAALVRGKYPALNHLETRTQIEKNADDKGKNGFDTWYGHGRINVYQALNNPPTRMMGQNLPYRR